MSAAAAAAARQRHEPRHVLLPEPRRVVERRADGARQPQRLELRGGAHVDQQRRLDAAAAARITATAAAADTAAR